MPRLYTLEQAAKLVDPDLTEKAFSNYVRAAEARYGLIFRDKSHRTHRMSLRQIELLVKLTWPGAYDPEDMPMTAAGDKPEAPPASREAAVPLAAGKAQEKGKPLRIGARTRVTMSAPSTGAGSRRGETARQIAELDARILMPASANVTPFLRGRRRRTD